MVYKPQMTLPRLELIYCPHRYIEEICSLQFASTRMNCKVQTLNASKIGYPIWSKLSNIVIVRSLLDILLAVVDMFPSYISQRGLNTSTWLYCRRYIRLGGKMWCWQPPQIRHHQDRDEAATPPQSRLRAWLCCYVLPYYPPDYNVPFLRF